MQRLHSLTITLSVITLMFRSVANSSSIDCHSGMQFGSFFSVPHHDCDKEEAEVPVAETFSDTESHDDMVSELEFGDFLPDHDEPEFVPVITSQPQSPPHHPTGNENEASVSEPSTLLLGGIGLLMMGPFLARRRKNKTSL